MKNYFDTQSMRDYEAKVGHKFNYRLKSTLEDGVHSCRDCTKCGLPCPIPNELRYWDTMATICNYHKIDKNKLEGE